MNIKEVLKIFEASDIRLLPESIMNSLQDAYKRNSVYKLMLELNDNDLSYDWFSSIYEDELAQRNQNKQDFTPNTVGILLSKLTGTVKGTIYEPTAGNGSLLIANWWYRKTQLGDGFKSLEHPIECWELSDRSIPILLFNLSIRGINAVVYHGDVISQDVKDKYILTNINDAVNEFSIITKN